MDCQTKINLVYAGLVGLSFFLLLCIRYVEIADELRWEEPVMFVRFVDSANRVCTSSRVYKIVPAEHKMYIWKLSNRSGSICKTFKSIITIGHFKKSLTKEVIL